MKNKYGLDTRYFKEKLEIIVRDVEHYTPGEMYRQLTQYAEVAKSQRPPSERMGEIHRG